MGITRAGRREGSQAGRREVAAGRSEFEGIKKMEEDDRRGIQVPKRSPSTSHEI